MLVIKAVDQLNKKHNCNKYERKSLLLNAVLGCNKCGSIPVRNENKNAV